MDPFENVVQLDESIEYPDGFNCVTIEGTGDERQDRVFSGLSLTALPGVVSSNGASYVTCTVTISDRNALNPFEWTTEFEECSTDDPFQIVASKYIQEVIGLWEEEGKINAIPVQVTEGKKLKIADNFVSAYAPEGYGYGLYYRAAWLEYTASASVTIATGANNEDEWWLDIEETQTDDVNDVSGIFYDSTDITDELVDNEIQIPNISGRSATVVAYFVPELGTSGEATINAEYDSQSVSAKVTVTDGGSNGYNIDLSANPSSIPPGSESTIEARVSNSDGSPVVDRSITFDVFSGPGGVYGGPVNLKREYDQEEEVDSSADSDGKFNTFSVQYPIMRINSIVSPGFTWNGKAKITDGSTVTLDGQEFSMEITPLTVNYDYGGYATVVLMSSQSAKVDDEIVVSGTVGGNNALVRVSISEPPTSVGTVEISSNPTSCVKAGTTDLAIVAYDSFGPATGTVVLTVAPEGRTSPKTVRLSTVPIVDEMANIANRVEVNTEFPITNITSVKYDNLSYQVASFACKTITLEPPGLPVSLGTAVVTYTSGGRATAEFNAADRDYIAYVTATKPFPDPETGVMVDSLDTCAITVGAGVDPGTIGIEVTANPESGNPGISSQITAYVTKANELGEPEPVTSGTLKWSFTTEAVGVSLADEEGQISDGYARTVLYTSAKSTGSITVTGEYLGVSDTCSVEIKGGTTKPETTKHDTTIVPIAHIYGTIDPGNLPSGGTSGNSIAGMLFVEGGVVVNVEKLGAAEGCDEDGGTNTDPFFGKPLTLLVYGSGYYAGRIVSAEVSGASINYDLMRRMQPFQRPSWDQETDRWDFSALYLDLVWSSTINTEDKTEFEIQIVTEYDDSPISGATVTIAGQSATSDSNGIARFTQLPVGNHTMYIKHPNFRDNQAGVPGGSGVYDYDASNDTYIVTKAASTKKFIVSKMDVDIYVRFEVYTDFMAGM